MDYRLLMKKVTYKISRVFKTWVLNWPYYILYYPFPVSPKGGPSV